MVVAAVVVLVVAATEEVEHVKFRSCPSGVLRRIIFAIKGMFHLISITDTQGEWNVMRLWHGNGSPVLPPELYLQFTHTHSGVV